MLRLLQPKILPALAAIDRAVNAVAISRRCAGCYSRPSPPTPQKNRSDRAQPTRWNRNLRRRTPESTSSRRSPFSTLRPTPRPRNTQTCPSDSPQSTSPAPKPPPAQSAETSVQRKCRRSSRLSSLLSVPLSSRPSSPRSCRPSCSSLFCPVAQPDRPGACRHPCPERLPAS